MTSLLVLAVLFGIVAIWFVRSQADSCRWRQPPEPHRYTARARGHATYFSAICQAMSSADFQFLAHRAPAKLARRVHRERQRIAVQYAKHLRREFRGLLRLARIAGTLSPDARRVKKLERLRLATQFSWHYHILVFALYSGLLLLSQLQGLTTLVSHAAIRLDTVTKQLGERAVIASELASSLDRRRLDLV